MKLPKNTKVIESLGEGNYLKIVYNYATNSYSVYENSKLIIADVDYKTASDKAMYLCYTQR